MTDAEAPEFLLPPGLDLPSEDADLTEFLVEKIPHTGPLPEVFLKRYGAFITAFTQDRISHMPTKQDVQGWYRAGYGFGYERIRAMEGGFSAFQRRLGFYPLGYQPTESELTERYTYIAKHLIRNDPDFDLRTASTDEVVLWASARNLGPERDVARDVLDGSLSKVGQIFEMGRVFGASELTHKNAFRVAQRALDIHGQPISVDELEGLEWDETARDAHLIVRAFPGGATKLWREFDLESPSRQSFTPEELVLRGLQHCIKHGRTELKAPTINELSTSFRFPSRSPINRHFKSSYRFNELVQGQYSRFELLMDHYTKSGEVTERVFRDINRRFSFDEEYLISLRQNLPVLVALSESSGLVAPYARHLLVDGLNLRDNDVYALQLRGLFRSLAILGIEEEGCVRWLLNIIPRLNPDEAVAEADIAFTDEGMVTHAEDGSELLLGPWQYRD